MLPGVQSIQHSTTNRYRAVDKTLFNIRHLPLKRTFDLCFSLPVLLIGFPIFLLIALLVKFSSKGPVFFKQERVGRGGKLFTCLKFRTMRPDADQLLENLLTTNPELRQEWQAKRKLANDPRITSIGRFLRKTSLDELPQFWNVLKGDLSVVGPRPVCADEVQEFYGLKAYKILQVRPGLTGVWQTSGRSTTTYDERVQMDENYINHHSFLFDIKLILKTIPKMLRPRDAC